MNARQHVFSGGPWEEPFGYSRAIRAGEHIYVAGTTAALPDSTVHAPGDAYAQAQRCFDVIEHALHDAGATMLDVVRTRIYLVDAADAEAVGRAHGERFASIRPAATMVIVAALVHPDMRVEIEAEAIASG